MKKSLSPCTLHRFPASINFDRSLSTVQFILATESSEACKYQKINCLKLLQKIFCPSTSSILSEKSVICWYPQERIVVCLTSCPNLWRKVNYRCCNPHIFRLLTKNTYNVQCILHVGTMWIGGFGHTLKLQNNFMIDMWRWFIIIKVSRQRRMRPL